MNPHHPNRNPKSNLNNSPNLKKWHLHGRFPIPLERLPLLVEELNALPLHHLPLLPLCHLHRILLHPRQPTFRPVLHLLVFPLHPFLSMLQTKNLNRTVPRIPLEIPGEMMTKIVLSNTPTYLSQNLNHRVLHLLHLLNHDPSPPYFFNLLLHLQLLHHLLHLHHHHQDPNHEYEKHKNNLYQKLKLKNPKNGITIFYILRRRRIRSYRE